MLRLPAKAWSTRRRAIRGDPDTDVLTRLIEGEADGERLTERRAAAQCIFLLNAGHETTTNLIGNALACADRVARAESARCCAAARRSCAPRSRSSCASKARTSSATGSRRARPRSAASRCRRNAGHAVHRRGQPRSRRSSPIPTASTRARTPNRHVAFGFGIHTCAGMNLARLEGADRDRPLPRALSGLRARRRADARRPRALSRIPAPAGAVSSARIRVPTIPMQRSAGGHRMNRTRRPRVLAVASSCRRPLALAQVKIGVIVSATGPAGVARHSGEEHRSRMCPKTIAGKTVEYIVLDDATDTTTAVQSTPEAASARTRSTRSSARDDARTRWRCST